MLNRSPGAPPTLLAPCAETPLPEPRTFAVVADALQRLRCEGQLDLPRPGAGSTLARWGALAQLGRRDLCLARLAEGHADAVAILDEANRSPHAGLYGVWASKAGGGAQFERRRGRLVLSGTVRFCSGAGIIDRALVSAAWRGGDRLVEVRLSEAGVDVDRSSWRAAGMDASATFDVTFRELSVPEEATVGPPGFYTRRCGFVLGGAGVAAVWLGGAAALFDAATRTPTVDEHQLALVGALHTSVSATDALLTRAAATIDAAPAADHEHLAATCRAAAERTARDALDLLPRVAGPALLGRDRTLGRRLADLQVYIRQHHGDADLARLGAGFFPDTAAP